MSKKAMVVLSGGQDSTTSLFWARHYYEEVHALTFDYGQKHRIEIEAAMKVASLARVASHEIVRVAGIMKSRSPLVDCNVPLETYSDYQTMDKVIGNRVELTFVPMRNAFFLTLAANRALYLDCYELVTGVCQMDNANYPDCRNDFVRSQTDTINLALGTTRFKIWTPLMHLSKAASVQLARDLNGCWEALAYSHTCYAGTQPPCILTAETACHACTLRAEGFREAGYEDPMIERFKQQVGVES
jgi:7-cyano-7-deazaguanine synthase